jgi:dipeptidyl aminopeptidase/acylaminoacyl peptidase
MVTNAILRLSCLAALLLHGVTPARTQEPEGLSIRALLSAPLPLSLVAAPVGGAIAWTHAHEGRHALLAAAAPEFRARELCRFDADDGRALRVLGITADGSTVLFVRDGSMHAEGGAEEPTEPTLWRVPLTGGGPVLVATTGTAVLAPRGARAAYAQGGGLYEVALDGDAQPRRIARVRGAARDLAYSPDGRRLAFAVARDSFGERYGFVAVLDVDTARLRYVDASVHADHAPSWSPDGRRLAFVRRLGAGAESVLLAREHPQPDPWEVRVADLERGTAESILDAPEPGAFAAAALDWLDDATLVVRTERDGFAQLLAVPTERGRTRPLSPAGAEVEHFHVDRRRGTVWFATNAGDVDRRHVWRAGRHNDPEQVTHGRSLEWRPVPTGDGSHLAHLASDARTPAHVRVLPLDGNRTPIAPLDVAASGPWSELVEPEPVVLRAADGTRIHAQWFTPKADFAGRRPALLFLHGGPQRQMLLGWHPIAYYHRCYALCQHLASRGYGVLSVNFRLGIGYGSAFRDVPDGGPRGAAEYQDVLAAAAWLRARDDVDPGRIGCFGGSYGGYLTALALARNSNLFAAGVDLHGVHDWNLWQPWVRGRNERGDDRAAWQASPVASLGTWRSPALFVHGDDDRNVAFAETIRIVRALRERAVPHEVLVLPDEAHSFRRHASWVEAFTAASSFLDRHLRDRATPSAAVRPGPARYVFDLDGVPIEAFTFKPPTYRGERLILVMHGTLRNADEYRDHAQAMAERFGALVVAPRFDRERFPSRLYQFGGILTEAREAAPPEAWTYRFVPALAASVRAMERRPDLPFQVIGHSAGGQFVVRMAAFQDTGAERLVAANPGSHLFPTRELPFGYGFGDLPESLSDDAALRRYLAAPLTLYLGTADDGPDRYFDQSEPAMRQGPGRLQRGRACFAAAKALADERGFAFAWRLVEADGVGHSHPDMFDHASCADALFGKDPR